MHSTKLSDGNTRQIRLIKDLLRARNKSVLKKLIRRDHWLADGDAIRVELWPLLCHSLKKSHSKPEFDEDVAGYIDKSPPDSPRKVPGFIDLTYCRHFNLDCAHQRDIEKILWSLAREHPEVTYCPLLYPLAALFLHYRDAKETFVCLSYLLEKSGDAAPVLPQTKTQLAKDGYVLIKLTNKFGVIPPRNFFVDQRHKLRSNHEIDDCFLDWTKWIFVGLSQAHLLRVVDCFLVEGFKFLLRVGLALLVLYKREHPADAERKLTLDKMLQFCEQLKTSPDELIRVATGLRRLSSVKIRKQYSVAEHDLHKHPQMVSNVGAVSPFKTPQLSKRGDMIVIDSEKIHISTRIAPRNFKSNIIDWYLLDIIWDWIPERYIVSEPQVIFCTDDDGSSLKTFFAKCDPYDATVLLIKTTNNEVCAHSELRERAA